MSEEITPEKAKQPKEYIPKEQSLLLNDQDAAHLLGVSRSKLWQLVNIGRLPLVKLPPRTARFRRSDLEKIAKGEVA